MVGSGVVSKLTRRIGKVAWCLPYIVVCCSAQTAPATGNSVDQLLSPSGVAYDSTGNLYVVDAAKNQVIELTRAGAVTVFAGTGEQGFSGDGGPAMAATLNAPLAVAIGSDGTVYIADSQNHRVRAIAGGQIKTVAGSGMNGFSAEGGVATAAALSVPSALAIDSTGRLLIADCGNQRIRRVEAGLISTIAGTGAQGFAGDEGAGTGALLNGPSGVAVASDGRIFISDSHNHRIRMVDTSGVIHTFAGSGDSGYDGDDQPATNAKLSLPRGIVVASSGAVIFADSDNHRVRYVDAQGKIGTLAGDGVQARYAEGSPAVGGSLDNPRVVALQNAALPAISDARNHLIAQVSANQALYTLLPITARSVVVTPNLAGPYIYGEGGLAVDVSAAGPSAEGSIILFEGAQSIGTANLLNGNAVLPTGSLSAGSHVLTVNYSGDGLHSAATSPVITLSVIPRELTALAASATTTYGATVPLLVGTLSGVLARDNGKVSAIFAANAAGLLPVGTYPISATLFGTESVNYTVKLGAGSGSLQILPASSNMALQTIAAAYVGLPVVLTATVTTSTQGTPTGSVTFSDTGTVIAAGVLTNGSVSAVLQNATSGSHSFTAAYSGDQNFLAASASESVAVAALPDFTLTQTGSGTQTVQGGSTAIYNLQISAQPSPFSGSVSFSASGLPAGAKATFSPPVIVPGNGSVPIVLAIQTVAFIGSAGPTAVQRPPVLFALIAFVIVSLNRKRSFYKTLALVFVVAGLATLEGCGARSVAVSGGHTYPLSITATSTSLVGSLLTHTTTVSLTVQ